MFSKIRCISFSSWRSKFLGFIWSTLASHICSTDSIPWVHHSREEGSLDYDGRLVRLQVYLKFNTIIHCQQAPLSTNVGRRRRGHTRGAWSSKYHVGCGGQPRAAPRSHRRALQYQCIGLEGGPVATTVGAVCIFPACYSSPAGNGDMRSRQLLFFAGRWRGSGSKLFWKEKI
jgi:hypothetical protein